MVKVKIVFYSMYGHIYTMAEAVAEGARDVEGAQVELFQVPELVPEDVLERSGAKKRGRSLLMYRWPSLMTWLMPMPLYLAHQPASATCALRCVTSLTRQEDCG